MRAGAVSVRETVREAVRRLRDHDVPEAVASAEVLMSELLGVKRGELAFSDGPLAEEQAETYQAWVDRRIDREPVQRILGRAYFRNLVLDLNEETLIPRPDTESVVDAAMEAIDRRGYPCRVLDVGTGSGAIAISIVQERPRCEVHATETSRAALEMARRNAALAGVAVAFHEVDLVHGLYVLEGGVDLLVSNPPYVRSGDIKRLAPEVRDHDPRAALDGGPDGWLFYRRIFAEAPPLLKEGADVVLEVGDGQAEQVLDLGRDAGFEPLGLHQDLAGTDRAALLRWSAR